MSERVSEWMSVRAIEWIGVWVEKSECVSERASVWFRVAAVHICGRNLLVFKTCLSDCTLEIFKTTVVIVQTGPVSYVARD